MCAAAWLALRPKKLPPMSVFIVESHPLTQEHTAEWRPACSGQRATQARVVIFGGTTDLRNQQDDTLINELMR